MVDSDLSAALSAPGEVALPAWEDCEGDERRARLMRLVEAARAGDRAAWEAIYSSMYPRLIGYARRRLDVDSASEAVSETMARAVAGIGRFRWRGAGFEGWVFGILHHVIIERHRRAGRDRRFAAIRHESDVPDVAERLLADEAAETMRAAFALLAPADQEILYLRVVVGLGSEAVAEIVGRRGGAVRMAQARALQRLRVLLGEDPR
ncbi:MAG TPA: sigma-70 family RNA polymerase sigma factor [Acidimicrobiales bacterium]|nr:sigma-70 family RNA polymerase sigma factor [Acidimicrobiales bacterium]